MFADSSLVHGTLALLFFSYHSVCRCSHFFIVSSMLRFIFLAFFLCVWKTLEKTKKIVVVICFPCMLSSSIKNKTPKRFPCSSFACWELSRVNSFSRFSFSLLFAYSRKPKTPKIFQCVSLNLFSFYSSRTEEKTMMKMLSGSHMNNRWTNKEPILPCLLLLNKMFADSSLVYGTLALLLLFSHRSVMQVKGNNDDIRWTGRGREKLVWTRLVLFE